MDKKDVDEIKICPECGYDGNHPRARFCGVCGHGFPHFNEKGIMRSAILTYGEEHQMLIAIEEMSELIKELCKKYRGFDNREHIIEELADVSIVLDEMKIVFDCEDDVQAIRDSKLDRLRRRIAEARRTEKRYWKVEVNGNSWVEWYDCTCPYCKKKFEKEDPRHYCPKCGQKIDGYIHEYNYVGLQENGKRSFRHAVDKYDFDESGSSRLISSSDENAIAYKSEITKDDVEKLCYGNVLRTFEETEAPKDEADETDSV